MRWTKVLVFTLTLFLLQPVWAQPSLRDIMQVSQAIHNRRGSGSNIEQAIRVGGMIIRIAQPRRGTTPVQRLPRTQPRYPNIPTTYPRRQPRTAPAPPVSVPGAGKPQGYDYIAVGGKTMRLDPSSLPLTVNPGGGQHAQSVQKAVQIWNSAGLGTLFAVTNGPADITVDWSGRAVSPGARAETRMRTSRSMVVPSGISVKSGGRNHYQLARVMTHELGHVLGLDHSDSSGDIMYRSETNGDLALSARDLQMVRWLYSQSQYVPVVGSTQGRAGTTSFALQPNSFCGHDH